RRNHNALTRLLGLRLGLAEERHPILRFGFRAWPIIPESRYDRRPSLRPDRQDAFNALTLPGYPAGTGSKLLLSPPRFLEARPGALLANSCSTYPLGPLGPNVRTRLAIAPQLIRRASRSTPLSRPETQGSWTTSRGSMV